MLRLFASIWVLLAAIPVSGENPVILGLSANSNGVLRVEISGEPGVRYHLQATDEPNSARWRNLASRRRGEGIEILEWPADESDRNFYRIRDNPIPPNHQDRYDALEEGLAVFRDMLNPIPDPPEPAQTQMGLPSMFSNGNRGWLLLTATNRQDMLREVDRYHALGADILKLDITYPILTPLFHAALAAQPGYEHYAGITATHYLLVYAELVQHARSLGMSIVVEHSSLIPVYAQIDPLFYYDSIRQMGAESGGRVRYRSERAAECVAIVQWLNPDYLSIVLEPEAQNAHFGNFYFQPLLTPAQWASYVDETIQLIEGSVPGATTRWGAGFGTWEDRVYLDLFLAIDELDYIDFHIYPVQDAHQHFMTNMFAWCDEIRAAGKDISIGEAWLYKADPEEVADGNVFHDEVYARDLFGFWEPLDIEFMTTVALFARQQDMRFLTFFWPNYLMGYLDYEGDFELDPGETPDDIAPRIRLGMAHHILRDAVRNPAVWDTEAGRVFRRLVRDTALEPAGEKWKQQP